MKKLIGIDIKNELTDAENVHSGITSDTYTKNVICGRYGKELGDTEEGYYDGLLKQFDGIVAENSEADEVKTVAVAVRRELRKLALCEGASSTKELFVKFNVAGKDEYIIHDIKIAYDVVESIDTIEKANEYDEYMEEFKNTGIEEYDLWLVVKVYIPMMWVLRYCTEGKTAITEKGIKVCNSYIK